MQFYLISDNIDTYTGMRLAGIDGAVVHEAKEVKKALDKAVGNKDIAIILITEKLMKLCYDEVSEIKLTLNQPLIVEIPDRHLTADITKSIDTYVREAVGIKL